jgi:predicted DNA-binding protein (MmcQ/YjbR family)
MAANFDRIEKLALGLPEAERVDIEAWGGEPSFRVRGKNFVFANTDGTYVTVKLSKEEAEAVVATVPGAEPTGYGLGRHGWVSVDLSERLTGERWEEVEEWILTSYTLVAPKRLARQVVSGDAAGDADA